jgi:glycosyltransferase involved in cell wall biosynthesis
MNARPSRLSYVLITPARNEETNIEKTIRSVLAQTVLPLRWVIVSDGSTDCTDQIVCRFCREVSWMNVVRMPEHTDRNFAAKVQAFNAGYAAVAELDYNVIGNLDADITFDETYIEFILMRFKEDPLLGVAGTPFVEDGAHYDYRFSSIEHVSGACQLFRRECFEAVGGYTPIACGAIDWTAVTTARMRGWRTQTFPEKVCYHHRKMGTGNTSALGVWFRQGRKDYMIGGHPAWEAFRSLYQMRRRPYILGGVLLIAGYAWAGITRMKRPVPRDLVAFHRKEQIGRLKSFLFRKKKLVDREWADRCAKEHIFQSLKRLEQWVEDHDYKGYDPADGLSSILRPLTFYNVFLERVLMQVVWRSPVNLRPILGIKPLESAIGRGYMARGYLSMLKLTRNEEYSQKARGCLDWLIDQRSPGYEEFCWGKYFDFASRGGRYPKFEPITVWTSLIGMAFLEGYETLAETRYLDVALSVCRWILRLPQNRREHGVCLSYTGSGGTGCTIHNHSMLAAAMLARTSKYAPRGGYLDLSRCVMSYSCASQMQDGSWYYGEEPKYRWIDNFHTGYNLDSLKWYKESTGDTRFDGNLRRGLAFYLNHFFEESGRPKYYHNQTYPVDSQCISQSIETLARFAEIEPAALVMAVKVATWAIENMQDRDGHFYYREYRLIKTKAPMIHWAQATMYQALCLLATICASQGSNR